jgi:transposase-like protein
MESQSPQRQKRSQRDYSLAFKLQVVAEVEKGELTYKQAQKKYGIQGRSTVLVWMRKHSILDWKELPSMSQKNTPEQRIKELESLLSKEKEKVHVLNVAIDIADELLKTDIRKKYLPKQSKKQNPRS